jgi:hypothetical protein
MKVFPISQKKKLGFIDARGAVVALTKQRASLHVANYRGGQDSELPAPQCVQGKWGLFRPLDAEPVVAPIFDQMALVSEGVVAVGRYAGAGARGGAVYHWGVIDVHGNLKIDHRFMSIAPFHDGLALAQRIDPDAPLSEHSSKARFGVIDLGGEFVVEPRWRRAFSPRGGVARVVDDAHRWGFIDAGGRVLVEPQYALVADLAEGYARVGVEDDAPAGASTVRSDGVLQISPGPFVGRMGWVDARGAQVVAPALEVELEPFTSEIFDFHGGLAQFCDRARKKAGFVDVQGHVKIEPRFESAGVFREGRARVVVDGESGFIDERGDAVIAPRYKGALDFSEGLAAVQISASIRDAAGKAKKALRWGFVDRNGETVIEPRYKAVSPFVDGLAMAIRDDDRWAYVDTSGHEVWTEKA